MSLLPQDRYIAELLGLNEEEMRWYKAEVQRRAMEGPKPAVVAGLETGVILGIVNLVIGIGLTVVSALLVPRPPQPTERGRLTTRQRQGDTLQVPSAFAPTYGFEAVQDIAPLGDPIPLIYTKREFINGQWYGGVRVNTPLLWSQIWSLGGSQMLRAVFLVSEGDIEGIHPYSFAIGNNTLGAYSFERNMQRIAVYSVSNGGRMAIGNFLSGSVTDQGASGVYASDIFTVDTGAERIRQYFSGAYKPSTSTSFGIYAPIANGLGYRINPRIRPLRQLQTKGEEYDAVDDAQAVAEAWKYKYCYSSKAGIVATSRGSASGVVYNLEVGDSFTYMLSAKSDGVYGGQKTPVIAVNSQNSDNKVGSQDGEETLVAVGQSVAGRQKQYDSNLKEGELYKVGSCLAILVSRSPVFISESDYPLDAIQEGTPTEDDPDTPGESAFYQFRVVRSGAVGVAGYELVDRRFFDVAQAAKVKPAESTGIPASEIWRFDTVGTDYAAGEIGERYYTASAFPQLFRCALGSVRLNRPTRYFEIGIRSTVAMQIQGMCNFADVPSEVPEFTYGTVTSIAKTSGATTNLVNGTFVVSASGGKGSGLVLTVVVVGGNAISASVQTPGSKYKEGDTVTVALAVSGGGISYVYYGVTSVEAVQTGTKEVSGYEAINWRAADSLDGENVEDNLTNAVFTSGSITSPEKRYSFFRLAARYDPNSEFIDAGNVIYCVASSKETPLFNYLRFRMNGEANWEIRLEPVSSWEVRHGTFTIIEMDADLSQTARANAGISTPFGVVTTSGRVLGGVSSSELFDIQGLRPKTEIGLSWTEGDYASNSNGTYLDFYARAAEAFVYDEISTSCSSSPEHEITYVNVFQPNDVVPQYDNLCLVGINVRATQEWSQFSQFSAYITGGIKVDRFSGANEATHLFPEILRDFMLDTRYGLGNEISPEQIDNDSFAAAAQFCYDNRFFYDGPKLSSVNWRQWAADIAATHCLLLIERGGIFYLEQAIPEKPEIKGMFTAGNCTSMELVMAEAEQRQPFSVSVKFRSERYGGAAPSESPDPDYGLFPEPQERLISHAEWGDGPTESIDMSDYCTSPNHAIKAARYIIGARRLSDHTVKIQTTYEALTSSIAPGDFIKVALDYTHYNQFVNGAVTGDGKLVSSTPMSDGNYTVLYWTGEQATEVTEGQLRVSNGGTTATPAGIVFTVKTSEIITRTYRIDSITPSEDGYDIEAIHTPVLSDGTLQLYAEWSNPSYWTEL